MDDAEQNARIEAPKRSDPFVRDVVGAWRRLAGGTSTRDTGRRTLVACSGGADSSALLLALAAVTPGPEACHVVHDMRPAEEAERDARRTAELCRAIGVPFHRVSVRVADEPGNLEANARRARYGALESLARERGLRYVATGHHADDQLETLLMRLVRGAGVRGMAGVRECRSLGEGVTLVRPMLGVTASGARTLCERAGWRWNEDATNADTSRLRAALRARVLPELRGVCPDGAVRASRSARALASADEAVGRMAEAALVSAAQTGGSVEVEREKFVVLPDAVRVEMIRRIYTRIVGNSGLDRLSQAKITTCIGDILRGSGSVCSLELAELRICASVDTIKFCKC